MSKKYIISVVLIYLMCSESIVLAESMRCGSALVRTGDSTEILLDKCGEPDKKERKPWKHDYMAEYWLYKGGYSSFDTVVKVEDNTIISIERAE